MSERPPPLIYKPKQLGETIEGLLIADVRRCRKRALEFNLHAVP